MTAAALKPYARCNTCGVDLPTKDAQRAHMDATMAEARQANPNTKSLSSHSTRVINPTPEEVEANRVRRLVESAVERATEDCCQELDDEVSRGRLTNEQVKEELRHYSDFADAWDEWVTQ